MRWFILLLLVIVSSVSVHAEESDDAASDRGEAAHDLLQGNDMAWAERRAGLLKRTPQELVALLGAVRKAVAQTAAYDATGFLGLPGGPRPSHATLEAEAGGYAKTLVAKDPWRAAVHTTLLRVSASQVAEILGGAMLPQSGVVREISAERAQALLAKLGGARGVRREPAPALRLMAGQRGRVEVGAQFNYVVDYEPEVGNTTWWMPCLGTLREGAAVRITATPRKTKGAMHVQVHARWSEVVRPMGVHQLQLRTSPNYKSEKTACAIQLPELRMLQARGEVTGPASMWIAAVAGRPTKDGEVQVILLQVSAR